jgi:hypothetical protein
MSTQVRQILLVVALDKIFDVADDTSIALASLQRRGSDLDNPRAGYRPSV